MSMEEKEIITISDDVSEIDDDYDDYDGHKDNPLDQVVVPEDKGELELSKLNNDIAKNNDFIAFSSSSEEEIDEEAEFAKKGENEEDKKILSTDYPWIINHDHSKQKEIADWLTMEIQDFVAYISPNREEIKMRNETISKIRNAVQQLWPDADLHVFGSYATDLYLPGSDIDCVVNSKSNDKQNRNSLYALASHLKKHNLATEIEVIAKARVPIIKFIEPGSKIHIDVSFERTNGLEAAKLIRGWLDSTPGLRELVLIVKQFLNARRLNNVHTGGLGGFSIICLVYSFLCLHPRMLASEIEAKDNLGVLLIDFFELYGKNFGYDHVALTVTDGDAKYLPKSQWRELHPIRSPFALAIQDPGDVSNNISRGSFNLRDIKKAFAGAFDLLTNRCFELDKAPFKERLGNSILGNVIKYRGKARDFKDERGLVTNKAIVENEKYHKKRSRIIHDNDDLNDYEEDGDDRESDDDSYHIEEPPLKRQRKNRNKKSNNRKRQKQYKNDDHSDGEDDYNPMKR